jgi:hypothetical protein
MCFNFSLNISIQVSTTTESQLPSAPDPEQSSSLPWLYPIEKVWAVEVAWHRSLVKVVGSWTGEFLDPPTRRAR